MGISETRGVMQKLRQKYALYFSEPRFPDT